MPIELTDEPTEAIFRSAPMTLVQFYVTLELARDVVYVLGRLGNVHFRDLNSKLTQFQRTFMTELRSIDTVESNLKYLESVMRKHATITTDLYHNLQADILPLPSNSEMDDLEVQVSSFFEKIKHLDDSYNQLYSQRLALLENRSVLVAVNDFHTSAIASPTDNAGVFGHVEDEDADEVALLNGHNNELEIGLETANLESTGFNSMAGTIATDKVPLLRKILWRTLRGNLYFTDIPITDVHFISGEKHDKEIHKSVIIVYIHGDFLKQRVKRIIQSLDGRLYDNVYGDARARLDTLAGIHNQINDLETVVESTRNHLIAELLVLQESFTDWSYITKRERLIYESLNKFDMDGTRRCIVGEGWIPTSEFAQVRHALKSLIRSKTSGPSNSGSQESVNLSNENVGRLDPVHSNPNTLFAIDDSGNDVVSIDSDDDMFNSLVAVVNELATNRTPPTYHKTNKLTGAFQAIVDAYGVATYQEVNPGLATVITFPFMFAIMFGDIGHGFIVMLISLYFVMNETKFSLMRNKDEIFDMAFTGRYVLLLMGVFSIYTGFLYNDIFSKTITLFSSGWEWKFPENFEGSANKSMTLVADKIKGKTYPIGLDWAWHGAENNLLFTNSYKMKLSILMGFIHMNYSLFFSLVNYRFFKSRVDIIGNFIPGFLFMQSIFGYLCLTIIYKWSVDWLGQGRQPPGLLDMLINMFLSPGKVETPLYRGQAFVQVVLVLIALVSVPWLLLYKPLVLRHQNKKAMELGYRDLHSRLHHNNQLQEEEEAALRTLDSFELNNDPPEEFSRATGEFHFPNDIEPLHNNSGSHGDDSDSFDLGDIVIHQVIHTIEFCLNCVSHTASYLRLWALSLAHAQLSTVLWSMTIQNAFYGKGPKGIIMTVILFGFWFVLTVCILVLMEGTSAMLHSLRLHWVEAMSKFFQGEGYAYEPFTFKALNL